MASAGPYANNLHFAPVQTDNYTNTQSRIFTGRMPDGRNQQC